MAITINGSGITSSEIADGTIVNADVNDVAASKLTGALPAISGASLTNLPGGETHKFVTGVTAISSGSSSFTVPSDATKIWIKAYAGGGGQGGDWYGGQGDANGGNGGNGGFATNSYNVTSGQSISYSVGTSGSGSSSYHCGSSNGIAGDGSSGGNTTLSINSVQKINLTGGSGGTGARNWYGASSGANGSSGSNSSASSDSLTSIYLDSEAVNNYILTSYLPTTGQGGVNSSGCGPSSNGESGVIVYGWTT